MIKYLAIMLWTGLALAQTPLKLQLPYKNDKANQLFEAKKYPEAEKAYQDLLAKDPENGVLAYNLGNVYNALGDTAKATEMYEKALKSNDPDAANRSRFNLGTLDLQSQKPQEAISNLTQYLRKSPNDLDAKRNLELALRQLQQQQQQDQNKDDKNQKDQQNQQDQQQSQGQQGKEDKDQKGQQGQDQNKDQQGKDQNKDKQGQDQNKDQQQKQNQSQGQDPGQQPQGQGQGQKSEQEKLNDQVKQQILDALDEQELRQQKQYQQRKIGSVRRRAKDW